MEVAGARCRNPGCPRNLIVSLLAKESYNVFIVPVMYWGQTDQWPSKTPQSNDPLMVEEPADETRVHAAKVRMGEEGLSARTSQMAGVFRE